MSKLSRDDVLKLAKLSQASANRRRNRNVSRTELSEILAYVEMLDKVDTTEAWSQPTRSAA